MIDNFMNVYASMLKFVQDCLTLSEFLNFDEK